MNYSFKTISKKVMGDLHTPVSIYLKVRDIYPESALLESSDFHGNENSLSFIALRPLASIGINNGECMTLCPQLFSPSLTRKAALAKQQLLQTLASVLPVQVSASYSSMQTRRTV